MSRSSLILFLLSAALLAQPQRPNRPQGRQTGQWEIVPGTSRVVERDGVEILTFETEETLARLEDLYRQTRQTVPPPATLTTLFFRSALDGSVQPYAVWLPKDYHAGSTWPLVVQLHGLNFFKTLAGPRPNFHGLGAPQWIDPNRPVIVVQCYGRQSTFYQGMGEEDVFEVIADVSRRFGVDPERVFIMGHSMGGAGSYTVGLHYPDRFGGITPIDAAMGSRVGGPMADLPEWMRPQTEIWDPSRLFPNARNVNVFLKNAGAGIQGTSTLYSDGIVAAGGFSTMESFPGMPHSFGQQYSYGAFVSQLTEHPIRRNPEEVKFSTNTLRYNQAYWVTIDRLARHNQEALVTAKRNGGSVTVATKNIDALTLRLGSAAAVRIDGQEVSGAAVLHLARTGETWQRVDKPAVGGKRHGLQGPIGDAFNSRFLAVYGSGDRDLAMAELDAVRNPPGRLVIHGDFPMKAAAKVTAQDAASSNLILFGTPESNAVLRRIADRLPPAHLRASGIFIYPNPENPERYVVVWNAPLLSRHPESLRAGFVMPVNLLPDYVEVKDGAIASAGFFDNDWHERQ